MATIEITAEQLTRLARATQLLKDAAGGGDRASVDSAARSVVTLVDVLVLPEHMATR